MRKRRVFDGRRLRFLRARSSWLQLFEIACTPHWPLPVVVAGRHPDIVAFALQEQSFIITPVWNTELVPSSMCHNYFILPLRKSFSFIARFFRTPCSLATQQSPGESARRPCSRWMLEVVKIPSGWKHCCIVPVVLILMES